MKTRLIALTAVLMLCSGLRAQYYNEYYHRTGDTVYYRSEIAYYKWWNAHELMDSGHYSDLQHVAYHGVHITPYFTSYPLIIVGIAGWPYSTGVEGPNLDHTYVPEYFYLYDNSEIDGSPVFLKRVLIDMAAPHRTQEIDYGHGETRVGQDSCCVFQRGPGYLDLYEFYFDTAVNVYDTFFVGWSFHSNDHPDQNSPNIVPTLSVTCYGAITPWDNGETPCSELDVPFNETENIYRTNSNCFFPIFDYLRCEDTSIASNPSNPNLQWISYRSQKFVGVYPLIAIDTTQPPFYLCDPVQNVQVTADSCAVVTWDDFLHYTYCNVQYYALEDGYRTAHTETVSGTNMLRICGLDSTKHYFVRVNAFCDTSKIETAWSAWVPFQLGGGTDGIAEGESALSHYTYLVPNPASDRLTVTSSFGITHIDVYSLSGVLVYSEPAGFSNHTVDLSGWAAGQYIVMVHTPHGITAKRLAVVR